jgi:hypothetical protein
VTDEEKDVTDRISGCDPVADDTHEAAFNLMRVNRCTRFASFAGTAIPSLTRAVAPDQPRDERAAFAGRMPEDQTRLTSVQSTVSTEPVVRPANRTSNPAPAGCPRGWTTDSGGDTNKMTRTECTVDTVETITEHRGSERGDIRRACVRPTQGDRWRGGSAV